MKVIGIQLKTTEVILAVLEKDTQGNITQSRESIKFNIEDPTDISQVRQFRDQINMAFDSISPNQIGILARNYKAKGARVPSIISFKWEGIIQLNDKYPIEMVWPQTTSAFFKKKTKTLIASKKYEEDAFDVAYYLLEK